MPGEADKKRQRTAAGIFAWSEVYIKRLVAGEPGGFCPDEEGSSVRIVFCVLPLPFYQKLVRYVRQFHRISS
jgi:hypothetical protein